MGFAAQPLANGRFMANLYIADWRLKKISIAAAL